MGEGQAHLAACSLSLSRVGEEKRGGDKAETDSLRNGRQERQQQEKMQRQKQFPRDDSKNSKGEGRTGLKERNFDLVNRVYTENEIFL
jgi:hypothetical protein